MPNKKDKENEKRSKIKGKQERGSISLDNGKSRETTSKGKAAQSIGTAHKFSSKESGVAGRKGHRAENPYEKSMVSGTANAIEMLKEDHEKIKELFREYRSAGEHAYQKKNDIAERVFVELDAHAMIEEGLFYPAMQTLGGRKLKELIDQSFKEHREVKTLIEDLRGSYPASEYYDVKLKMLMETVERHIEREEGELFPEAEEKLGDKIERLGTEMKGRKDQIRAVR